MPGLCPLVCLVLLVRQMVLGVGLGPAGVDHEPAGLEPARTRSPFHVPGLSGRELHFQRHGQSAGPAGHWVAAIRTSAIAMPYVPHEPQQ
ncbi:hypothetical protein SSPIM334S_06965 [Streptomyces spiroverticillatus]